MPGCTVCVVKNLLLLTGCFSDKLNDDDEVITTLQALHFIRHKRIGSCSSASDYSAALDLLAASTEEK